MLTTSLERTDQSLLRDVHGNDQQAFALLFERHYGGVYAFVFRIVGVHEEAEEIAQETFLKLYRKQLAPTDDANVRGWLFKVAANAAFNLVRSRNRRTNWLQRVGRMNERHASHDPQEIVAERDDAALVRQHLNALPERQRMVLVMRASGLSYAEIAAATGIKTTSVGTILARAERALRDAYFTATGQKEVDE